MLALTVTAVALTAAFAAPTAGAETTVGVDVRDFAFRSAYQQIEIGDSVRWTQNGTTTHTVTSLASAPEPFAAQLQPGETFTRLFPTPGRYAYHCTIHPEMRGTIQVGPDRTTPKFVKPRFKRTKRTVSVSFRLPEDATVAARLATKAKPSRSLRRSKARQLIEGRRSVSLSVAGLAPGDYRFTVRAVDRGRNAFVYLMRFRIPKP